MSEAPEHTATDPVCGMAVDPRTTTWSSAHNEHRWYFCCSRCQEKFDAEPSVYVTRCGHIKKRSAADGGSPGQASSPAPGNSDLEYICPMCPEVSSKVPDACPVCGMALEPSVPTLGGDEAHGELVSMTRRLWISLAFTLPLFILAMSEMIPGEPFASVLTAGYGVWIQVALATPVVLWCGWPGFVRGCRSVVT